ncbi:cell wall hydrolase [Thiohalocapsa marina]|uniref:Cell wall hydrolase n=1 Tax=Thiohalocapsa marina TaxID=424902 RepID=A0A5M8FEU4_9GAMM|nr:cell wall hydrolase [Thiohalocapsa marina]KAA6183403.1 cell wall hydrolase [Thiohalocapsa marina]
MRIASTLALGAALFPTLLLASAASDSGAPVSERGTTLATATTTTESSPAQAPAADPELLCLALNIYHEARSEPESGQMAVARVTLNRVASDAFPGSICGVVKQGGQQRNRCQFSWWCDGKSDHPTEQEAWHRSLRIGRRALAEKDPDPTRGALYYHAHYVKPSWSRAFQRTAQIGQHLFYRPTQS